MQPGRSVLGVRPFPRLAYMEVGKGGVAVDDGESLEDETMSGVICLTYFLYRPLENPVGVQSAAQFCDTPSRFENQLNLSE
ncbi:MAG: hypothetical protein GXP08_10445 [Gammaproteobacteria bacterium]|nr:hypothetical protein [Gammaproteobacteria bacterium]